MLYNRNSFSAFRGQQTPCVSSVLPASSQLRAGGRKGSHSPPRAQQPCRVWHNAEPHLHSKAANSTAPLEPSDLPPRPRAAEVTYVSSSPGARCPLPHFRSLSGRGGPNRGVAMTTSSLIDSALEPEEAGLLPQWVRPSSRAGRSFSVVFSPQSVVFVTTELSAHIVPPGGLVLFRSSSALQLKYATNCPT